MTKLLHRLRTVLPREGRYWLALTAALAAIGILKGINLILLLSCLLVGALLLNVALAGWQLRRIRATRDLDTPVFAGQPLLLRVDLSPRTRHPAHAIRVFDTGRDHAVSWFVPRLDADGPLRLRGSAAMTRRGRYPLDPLRAVCLFPFGLVRWTRRLDAGTEVLVLPRLGRLDLNGFRRWLERAARGETRTHRSTRPSMISPDDLHGLREFRAGDSPRWIHWRTSARRSVLMVREFEETAGQDLVLVLDPVGLSEDAVSLAATLAWDVCRAGGVRVGLVVAAATPRIEAGPASRDLAVRMLEALAVAEAAPTAGLLDPRQVPDAAMVVIGGPSLADELARACDRPVVALQVADAREWYVPPDLEG